MAKGSRPGGGGTQTSTSGGSKYKTRADYDKAIGELNGMYDKYMGSYKDMMKQADSIKGRSKAAKEERAKIESAASQEYRRAMMVYQTRAGLQQERDKNTKNPKNTKKK